MTARHLAPQSFDAERREYLAEIGFRFLTLGRHVAPVETPDETDGAR